MCAPTRCGGRHMTLPGTMLTFIARRDHTLMRRINRWPAPRWVRIWMLCATRGGDGWLWYAMGLVILLFGGDNRFLAVGAAALAAGTGIAIFLRLKKATGRKRPTQFEPHCWATLLPPDQFSFPSGHTITAFAVAVSLEPVLPRPGDRPVLLRVERGRLAHPAGHAFPERRAGRRGHRLPAGLRLRAAVQTVLKATEPASRSPAARAARF